MDINNQGNFIKYISAIFKEISSPLIIHQITCLKIVPQHLNYSYILDMNPRSCCSLGVNDQIGLDWLITSNVIVWVEIT